MFNIAFKYGLIAAAVLIAVIILPFWFQNIDAIAADPEAFKARMRWSEVVGYLTMLAAMGLIVFALREYRARLGGSLGFAAGLKLGVLVSLIAASLFGVATAALYAAMGPEQTDAFMRIYMEHAAGPDPAAQARALADYESNRGLWLNPAFQAFIMFATVLPIGVLVSLLAAWWLRRT
jgi:hypothetical protein